MPDAPTVSVIIPTYNRAHLLGNALCSVLTQSWRDLEVIVVDDGSTDGTAEVVRTYGDERLIFIRQQNRGRSAARNRALALARGRYVAFLDSDDEYMEGKLELQVAYLDANPQYGMVYTSACCVDAEGRSLGRTGYVAVASGDIYRDVAFFRPLTITLPTVMVRGEVLNAVGGFDEAMERFEDTDMWRRIAKHHQIGALPDETCILRTHAGNVLAAQNPHAIVEAIEYYVAKVFHDDADIGRSFLTRGASSLFEYYGKAFLSIPGWRRQGLSLLRRAVELAPARCGLVSLAGGQVALKSLVKQYLATSGGEA